ncbi:MAG: hypothetical protein QME66_06260 [Candidatus Eisenbacteria bacterium]|nr:hypothetical protein [Candidatus Eisenbacteria bacterium]
MQEPKEDLSQGAGCFLRLYWMCFGNIIAVLLLVLIIEKPAKFLSAFDAAYWFTFGSLVLVRYADVRYFRGLTADGSPASLVHWRRYAVILTVAALGTWLLAHFLKRVLS